MDICKFSLLTEWLLIFIANYIAGDDKEFLARIRRDIQSITPDLASILRNPRVDISALAAFIELLYPVKYMIFNISDSL